MQRRNKEPKNRTRQPRASLTAARPARYSLVLRDRNENVIHMLSNLSHAEIVLYRRNLWRVLNLKMRQGVKFKTKKIA